MKIDINLSIFKKSYAWSALATIMFIIVFITWLCGMEPTKVSILCLFSGAICGNFNAAIAEHRNHKGN